MTLDWMEFVNILDKVNTIILSCDCNIDIQEQDLFVTFYRIINDERIKVNIKFWDIYHCNIEYLIGLINRRFNEEINLFKFNNELAEWMGSY